MMFTTFCISSNEFPKTTSMTSLSAVEKMLLQMDLSMLEVLTLMKLVMDLFSDWKELGYLGILNYSYDDKYIVDLSYRYDGSSRFAADYRFGSFWSAAVAWNLTEEDFLADSDIIKQFKT